jgi:transcriptional regulator with XRE-family HTH domain
MLPLCGDSVFQMNLDDTPQVACFGDKILYHLTFEMNSLAENATVAERIRYYRMKRHMTDEKLAELAGISRHAIMDYETGLSEPSLMGLNNISSILNVEADKLYDDYYRFLNHPFNSLIKKIRTDNNLRQSELGRMLNVGIRTIRRWEEGINTISRATWEMIKAHGLM